jgi:predicted metal-binding protein
MDVMGMTVAFAARRTPPHIASTRELVDCYKYALLVHFTEDADNVTEDPIDLTKVITTLERDIFLAGY